MVTLSVIVPMCNVRDYCRATLKSLALNARSDFEFIVVDDRSTDGTFEILRDMIPSVPGALLLRNSENKGISATRNVGLAAARGTYVTFLDGDDWFAPGYLAKLVDSITAAGVDFVRTGHVRVYGKKREVVRAPVSPRAVPLDPASFVLPVDASSMVDYPLVWAGVYDRERLLALDSLFFDQSLRTAEDRHWMWRLHLRTRTFAVTDLHGIFYRRDVAGSLTKIPDERQLDFIKCYEKVFQEVAVHERGYDLSFKVMRTLCAMIVVHLDRADTYDEFTRGLLMERSARALHNSPQDVLEETLRGMDARRVKKLRALWSDFGVAA
ncbi:glycosyltransferase family 2 protein [Streptomyces nitrosporeus]|uniref:glycosyltransferase family 2 protein n=1 Tax=Streptomyces nitrosporeus TaxID=28894 RepID=UPI00399F1996